VVAKPNYFKKKKYPQEIQGLNFHRSEAKLFEKNHNPHEKQGLSICKSAAKLFKKETTNPKKSRG
jgi:hypothetical protein